MDEKKCSNCGKVKLVSEFSPRITKSGNRVPRSWCKKCNSILSSKIATDRYWARVGKENRTRIKTPIINGKKECTYCHIIKPINEFPNKITSGGDIGVESQCKNCRSEQAVQLNSKKWRTDPIYKSKRQERDHEYQIDRNQKAKVFSPDINADQIVRITCEFCGIAFGVLRNRYNASIKFRGHPPQFCSISCSNRYKTKPTYPSYSQKIKKIKNRLSKVPRVLKPNLSPDSPGTLSLPQPARQSR